MNKAKADDLRIRLGFDFMYQSESDGKAGGLVLFYMKDYDVVLNYKSANFIDVLFMADDVVDWRLT